MAKPAALKPEEIVSRGYADRLLLEQLTELHEVVKVSELADRLKGTGLGLSEVKSLLASNPERFAYHERRWIPATRLSVAGRPFSAGIDSILDAYGGPMSFHNLNLEMSRALGIEPEECEFALRRTVDESEDFVVDAKDRIGLTKWGFLAHDETRARALALNEITEEQIAEVAKKVAGITFRGSDYAEQALKAAAPIKLKLLGAAAWATLNSDDPRSVLMFDAREFLKAILSVDGYELGSDGTIALASEAQAWINQAVKLSDRLIPTVDVDDAVPIEISTEVVEKIVAKILNSPATVTATKILEEFYEITVTNKTFPDDLRNLMEVLVARKDIVWVGGDRFQKPGLVPDYINELPEAFDFVETTNVDEEGELIDVELTDDGLNQTLRKLISHPLAIDVLDDDNIPAPKIMPNELRLVLKAIHRELGTFPICQFPKGWIAENTNVQELIVRDSSGKELQIWANLKDGLTYNWIEWWLDQPVENGAVFTLNKTNRPNVVDFAWLDQPDPVVYISAVRMEELRNLGIEAEGKSTLDLLIKVMSHWTKGADYLTILAELNVARRSTRRLVASLLSSYQCFYQRSGSPVWHYDPKKVELGFDKSKRKFVKK